MAEEKKKYYRNLEDLPGVGGVTAEKLRNSGYGDFSKLATASPHELSEVAGLGVESAKKAIEAAKTMVEIGFESADVIFERRKSIGRITTNSKNLDEREVSVVLNGLKYSYSIFTITIIILLYVVAFLNLQIFDVMFAGGLLYLAHILPAVVIGWYEKTI